MKTTIQISDDFRKRLKAVASMRDVSYEEALEDMADLFRKVIPFTKEEEFAAWFEKNLDRFGFKKIIEKRKKSYPDYRLEDFEGNIKEVELELTGTDFIRHKHDPKKVDLILCIFSSTNKIEGVPILSLIEEPEDENGIIDRMRSDISTVSIPKPLTEKIRKTIEGTGFNTVSGYVAFVMRLMLAEQPEKDETISKETEERVKAKLRSLGYLK